MVVYVCVYCVCCVMCAGDNIHTAKHIARECGILPEGSDFTAMEGPDFRKLTEEEMNEMLPKMRVRQTHTHTRTHTDTHTHTHTHRKDPSVSPCMQPAHMHANEWHVYERAQEANAACVCMCGIWIWI